MGEGTEDFGAHTCRCGVTYDVFDEKAAAEHRDHRLPHWVSIRKGMTWNPVQWGPWHMMRGSFKSTAECGANLFRHSRSDTRQTSERPTERLCPKCARLPERPWETPAPAPTEPTERTAP